MNFIEWIDKGTINEKFCEKISSLSDLASSKFPVPKGFVLKKEAHEIFFNEIEEKIDSQLEGIHHSNIKEIQDAAKRIQMIVLQSQIPFSIIKEIKEAYGNMNVNISQSLKLQELGFLRLGEKCDVAVRSCPFSDDKKISDNHKLITYLNVSGLEQLRRAILGCYASLFSTENIKYRLINKIFYKKILNEILVQKMVHSDKSGIMHTSSPSKGRKFAEMRAVWGLGKGLEKNKGDHYIIEKKYKRIVEANVVSQFEAFFCSDMCKVIERELPENKFKEQKLGISDLFKLSKLSLEIESKFGPQKIEFAFDGNELYILSMEEENDTITENDYVDESEEWLSISEDELNENNIETSKKDNDGDNNKHNNEYNNIYNNDDNSNMKAEKIEQKEEYVEEKKEDKQEEIMADDSYYLSEERRDAYEEEEGISVELENEIEIETYDIDDSSEDKNEDKNNEPEEEELDEEDVEDTEIKEESIEEIEEKSENKEEKEENYIEIKEEGVWKDFDENDLEEQKMTLESYDVNENEKNEENHEDNNENIEEIEYKHNNDNINDIEEEAQYEKENNKVNNIENEDTINKIDNIKEEYIKNINEQNNNNNENINEQKFYEEDQLDTDYDNNKYNEYNEDSEIIESVDETENKEKNLGHKEEFFSKIKEQLKRYSNLYPHARSALDDFSEEIKKNYEKL